MNAEFIDFIPFQARHLFEIKLASMQVEFTPLLSTSEQLTCMEIPGVSGTCVLGTRILGCAGLLPQWPGRAVAWAVFGNMPRRAWPELTRRIVAGLDKSQANGTRRIETAVLSGFHAAHRWARRIGFEPEHPMEKYGPNGELYWMYSRIR